MGCTLTRTLTALTLLSAVAVAQPPPDRSPDVPFVPTDEKVVARMLELADVGRGDRVFDLGCGDGRIVISAARDLGARGVGVDIDPVRIRESEDNARAAGVEQRVTFLNEDLFNVDLREADAVTLYLLPNVNVKLRPKLLQELRPGTRVVSHDFDMGEWKPDHEETVRGSARTHTLYTWVVPARVDGAWRWTDESGAPVRLTLEQRFQKVVGTLHVDGGEVPVEDARLVGDELTFTARMNGSERRFTGRVDGARIVGSVEPMDARSEPGTWVAGR